MNYETTRELEIALSRYFGIQKNIIVPNVTRSSMLMHYEMDLCILSWKGRYATEVEIKISKSDLKADTKKWHHHSYDFNYNRIKYLWFAMPECLKGNEEIIPPHAGILYVDKYGRINVHRKSISNKNARKWDDADSLRLARLSTLRVWSLKEKMMTGKSNSLYTDERIATK